MTWTFKKCIFITCRIVLYTHLPLVRTRLDSASESSLSHICRCLKKTVQLFKANYCRMVEKAQYMLVSSACRGLAKAPVLYAVFIMDESLCNKVEKNHQRRHVKTASSHLVFPWPVLHLLMRCTMFYLICLMLHYSVLINEGWCYVGPAIDK